MALKFKKHNEKHAISEFIATLRFASAVGGGLSEQVATKAQDIANKLNLPAPFGASLPVQFGQPMFSVAFGGPMGVSSPSAMPPMPTIGFQRFSANGEAESRLICEANAITYTSRNYPGWVDQLTTLTSIFTELGLIYIKECPLIAEFKLQYLNEFTSNESGFVRASEIFRASNVWIAAAGRKNENLWHSHSGKFISLQDARLLVNVNADVNLVQRIVPPSPITQVKVLILVSEAFDVPDCSFIPVSPENLAPILSSRFDALHTQEKKVVEEVFADNYLLDIGAK